MYIDGLRIFNIRCFEKQVINFQTNNKNQEVYADNLFHFTLLRLIPRIFSKIKKNI